ncbi:TPA: thermonuclease family protein [Salmonella enterica]|nr:thermonuclease family protein [Salmonella enterica]
MKCRSRLLVFLPLLFPALCLADFSGRVVRVVDGDTVQVLADGKMMKVRLNGIEAPESGQPFGQRSKQNLLKLAVQKQTVVIANNTDRYGRWLGTLMIDGIDINAEQVKAGMAWAYRYHGRASDETMLRLEEEARRHKIGLWSSSDPVEPWKWRKQNK